MKRVLPLLFLTIAMLLPGLLCNAQTVLYYDFEDGQIPAGVTLKRITQLNEYNESIHSISIIDASQGGDQTLNNYDPSHYWPKYNADWDQTGFINSVDLKNPRSGNILTFNDHNDYDDGYTYVQSEMTLPVFDFSNVSTSVNIDFWMAQQALPTQTSTNYDYIKVFYSTNGTSWNEISGGQINRYNSTAQWVQHRVTTTALNGKSTAYIKLRFSLGKNLNGEGSGSSNTYSFYDRILFIDDLKVSVTESLAAPKQFVVLDAAEDAVLAQWTRTASETVWEVLYVPQGTAISNLSNYESTNLISVTDAHATIASNVVTVGFPFPETGSWDLYVRAVSGNNHSDWSLRQEMTTGTGEVQSMLYNEFDDNQSGGGELIVGEQAIDFETGDLASYGFSNTVSNYPWIIWNSNPNDGTYCIASSNNGVNSSESYIDMTVNFATDGYIDFYSRVSSESVSYDWGAFYIDNEEQYKEGGTTPNTWTNRHYTVAAGSHTFRWYYRKDVSVSSGEDRYYIDDITFYGTSAVTIGAIGEYTAMRVSPYCLKDPHGDTYDYLDWGLDDHGLNDNSAGEFQGRDNVLEYYPDEQAGVGRYSTPLLDFTSLSSSDAVAISFMWFFRHYHTATGDVVQLQYSLDGSTWTNIGSAQQTYNADPHWAELQFETSALSGKYGYLGLQFTKVIDNWLAAEEDYVVQHHMYLDDWLIRPKQAMAAPLNFTAAAITESTATFGWNAVTGATSYTLLQVPTGTTYYELDDYLNDNPCAATTVTGTYTTLRDLEENADFFVRANNGNSHSSWSMRAPVTLNSDVTLADALLYTFTDEPSDLSAWTTEVMTGYTEKGYLISDGEGGYLSDDRVSVYGSYGDTGESLGFSIDEYDPLEAGDEGCLSFFHSTTETDQLAPKARIILGPVDLTDANSAQIDFDWLHNTTPTSTADKIDILYSMDAGLTWTAIRSGLTRKGSSNAWTHYTNSVAAMNGGVALIAIDFYMVAKANSETEANRMYIDNIQVTPIYDCDLPTNLANTFANDNSATITWTGGDATNWTAICFEHGSVELAGFEDYIELNEEDADKVQNVDFSRVTFTGLSSDTQYDVFVRANCDEDTHSAWSVVCSFTTTDTGCEALDPSSDIVLHEDDFSDYTYSANNANMLGEFQGNCYTFQHVAGTSTASYGFYVSNYGGTGASNDARLTYKPNAKNTKDRIILPALDLTNSTSGAKVSFSWYCANGTGAETTGYGKLQYSVDGGVTWTTVATHYRLGTAGWTDNTYFIDEVAGTFCLIGFEFNSGSTAGNTQYLDNLRVVNSSCRTPENFVVDNVIGTSVTVSWTEGMGTEWEIVCGDPGDDPNDMQYNLTDITTGSATLTSNNVYLQPNTTYDAYVRAVCDYYADDYSSWSAKITFTTGACDNVTNAYYTFYTYDDWADFLEREECVTATGTGFDLAEISEDDGLRLHHSGTSGNARLQLPPFSFVDEYNNTGAMVSFDWYHQSTNANNDKVEVQYSHDGTTWTTVGNAVNRYAATEGWINYKFYVSAMAYQAGYISLLFTEGNGTGDMYLDNLSVEATPLTYYVNEDQTLQDFTIDDEGAYDMMVINNNATLTITGTLTNNGTAANLVIESGSQLVTSNPVMGTMQLNITGTSFGSPEQPTSTGYYLISSPVASIDPDDVTNMIPASNNSNYDLYAWDATEELEWRNYKDAEFILAQGLGYLYANTNTIALAFAGQLNGSFQGVNSLYYAANDDLHSLTLVGNPFAYQSDFSVYNSGTMVANLNYLTMNAAGDGFTANAITDGHITLNPMQAALVQATASGESFNISQNTTRSSDDSEMPGFAAHGIVNIKVHHDNSTVVDNAIVRFAQGSMLRKIYLSPNSTRVYIPSGNDEMAIVRGSDQGELPVNFKAETDGTYTISIDNTTGLSYLHLIDNMTGANIDLLQEPIYSFEARTTDYASRFRLVFDANNDNGSSAGSETFAFFNGSAWVISNEGEAVLQVVDVTGRVLRSEQINGDAEVNVNEAAGVYLLRLVNGDNVRTQKIVVR